MTKLRLGLLGAGQVARNHKQALADRVDCSLDVVFDPQHSRAESLASDVPGLELVGSADAVIDADVDAVVISAPTAEHFDLGVRALRAGRHVLMEKPFARTGDEARHLDALAESLGLVLMPAQVARFLPAVVTLRRSLAEHDPGALVQAVERRLTYRTEVFPWWQSVPEFLIPHWGSHSLDVFLWLAGDDVAEVRCWASSRQAGYDSVDDFTLVAQTNSGAVLSLHQTFASREELLDWVMVWEHVTATVAELRLSRWNGATLTETDQQAAMAEAFAAQDDEFVRSCLGERSLDTTVASVLPSLNALERAVRDAGIDLG